MILLVHHFENDFYDQETFYNFFYYYQIVKDSMTDGMVFTTVTGATKNETVGKYIRAFVSIEIYAVFSLFHFSSLFFIYLTCKT